MQNVATLSMNKSVTIQNIKLCEIDYCKMKTQTSMQHESKLKCYGMRESRQEIEVLHKAPKKPVRKPAA